MSAPKLMPALLGGLFIGVLSSLPIIEKGNLCCCLWVVSGGVLAAWLMQQNTPRPVTLGEGALVGLLAGLAGVVSVAVFRGGLALVMGMPPVVEELRRGMETGARDPEARAFVEGMGPMVLLGIFGLIFAVVSTVMATIGGLLGALIFRRKSDGSAVPPPSGPPPSGPPPSGPFAPMPPMPPAPPPAIVPPPSFTPPAPPVAPAAPASSSWPSPPIVPVAPAPPDEDEPYVGDAPTILIPMRGPTLGPPPTPPAPPVKPVPPAGDGEPESH